MQCYLRGPSQCEAVVCEEEHLGLGCRGAAELGPCPETRDILRALLPARSSGSDSGPGMFSGVRKALLFRSGVFVPSWFQQRAAHPPGRCRLQRHMELSHREPGSC